MYKIIHMPAGASTLASLDLPDNAYPVAGHKLEPSHIYIQPAGSSKVLKRGPDTLKIAPFELGMTFFDPETQTVHDALNEAINAANHVQYIEHDSHSYRIAGLISSVATYPNRIPNAINLRLSFMPTYPLWTVGRVQNDAEYESAVKVHTSMVTPPPLDPQNRPAGDR